MSWFAEYSRLSAAGANGLEAISDHWSDDVLAFWFAELKPIDWFTKNDATDAVIGQRFLKLYAGISQLTIDELCNSAEQALAAIIVLDQFPRNLFRGNGQSFKTDKLALSVANKAIAAGFDKDLTLDQRLFLYLPLEHSEDLADQERAVELISSLGDENYTSYAIAHRDLIVRFGRFPHRNAMLGRTSTDEEAAYLAEPGSGF